MTMEWVATGQNGINHLRNLRDGSSGGMATNAQDDLINKILPKELLLSIFSYLDVPSLCRCARVSKYWNQVALDGSNWQYVDLFSFQTDVEGRVVENLSKRCGGFLKSLSLRGCLNVSDTSLRMFAQNCQNIVALNLNGCTRITDSTCQSLGQCCKKLQRLDLESCNGITDSSLFEISNGCHFLEYISVSWCHLVTDAGIEYLAQRCNKLRSFVCRGCKQLTDDGFKHLGHHCHALRSLNLQGSTNITDETVISVSEGCHHLISLCVSKCFRLTDASLVHLGQHCPELRTLEVANCSQFTHNGFIALLKNCHQFERVDLEDCVLVTDATLALLAHCPRLSRLLLSKQLGDREELPFISSQNMQYSSARNSLSHCELITDEGISHLGASPYTVESLTILELDNCPLLTDMSLTHLTRCRNLQRVELYDCQLITRGGIQRLKSHLQNIRVHAYFAPATPPVTGGGSRRQFCRCCVIV